MDPVYQKFVKRWEEVTDVPPQTVGPFTPIYRIAVRQLKVMPWPVVIIVCCVLVFGLLWLFGPLLISAVSLLQRGF